MSRYDYETEKIVVYYERQGKRKSEPFCDEESAAEFARKMLSEGYAVKVEETRHMVGWY